MERNRFYTGLLCGISLGATFYTVVAIIMGRVF